MPRRKKRPQRGLQFVHQTVVLMTAWCKMNMFGYLSEMDSSWFKMVFSLVGWLVGRSVGNVSVKSIEIVSTLGPLMKKKFNETVTGSDYDIR